MKKLRALLLMGAIGISLAAHSQSKPAENTDKDKTVFYTLERNDPNNSGLFGVGVYPLIIDLNGLNLNLAGALEVFYTYQSKIRVNAGYRFSYLDNPKGQGQNGDLGGTLENRGVPSNYKKASQIYLQAHYSIMSWEKEGRYNLRLGSIGPRTEAIGLVSGSMVKTLTARLGYQLDNRIIESEDGIGFTTTTPEYTYHYEGEAYQLQRHYLATSATMMQSNIIMAGIALSTFGDIKIDLDDERFKGRREEKSQSDIFVDVLYAHKLKLRDMIYYHSLYNYTQEHINLPDRVDLSSTPLSKTGIRIGYQEMNMYKPHFGTKFLIEAGIRPGPKFDKFTRNAYGQITFAFIFGGRSNIE